MRFVPYHKLDGISNIIVDGPGTAGTVLTLSHWPKTATPLALKADLSAGIVFNYLDQPDHYVEADAVSNNHFDEDGLVGLWSMLNPEEALERRTAILDVAGAGDFGTYKDRDCARISFVISAWTRPDSSPLSQSVFQQSHAEVTMILYEELLPRLANIMDRVDQLHQFWQPQDEILERSEKELEQGDISIEEIKQIDLAIINVPSPVVGRAQAVYAQPWDAIVHPFAIHNATDMMRILLVQGARFRLYYRYETWVQYQSRLLMPRMDLSLLAEQLNQLEGENARWQADDIDSIVPQLQPQQGRSSLAAERIIKEITSYLSSHT